VFFFFFFSYVLFSRILKNNKIGSRLIFCFLMVHFLRSNDKLVMEELSSIKKNCHYGKGSN
jgi:hypothetical protein